MKLFESRLHEKRKWLEMSRELGVTTLGIRTMKLFTRLLTWIGTYICFVNKRR